VTGDSDRSRKSVTFKRNERSRSAGTAGHLQAESAVRLLRNTHRKGRLEIETDTGDRIAKDLQKAFLATWHLELSAGQYRKARNGQPAPRATRLVKNIVLSMPSPTSPEKVLAAARAFAREKFAGQHRYALVLHTDQQHPHVHLVVKAEGNHGRKLHIDKPMLRAWREDFARLMREQGVAANATPRFVRGRSKRKAKWGGFRAQRHGTSTALLERVKDIANELVQTGTIRDPARQVDWDAEGRHRELDEDRRRAGRARRNRPRCRCSSLRR
jgi:hypothetical protein